MSESSITFSTFGSVTVNDTSRVTIPDDLRADLQRAAAFFDGQKNTTTLGPLPPFADDAAAKLFAKQVRQWAEDHKRSATVNRDGNVIASFRIAKVRKDDKPKNGEVTTTQGEPQPVNAGDSRNATARDGRS